jgi:hypothetical protein
VFESFAKRGDLEKGTEVGFDFNEIKLTTSEDLYNLRKSILLYLKSKKLKKRNGNFMEVFQRINLELRRRKSGKNESDSDTISTNEQSESTPKRSLSFKTSASLPKDCIDFKDYTFLSRKSSSSSAVLDIPSFLQDKKQKIGENESIQITRTSSEEKPCFRCKF